MNPPILFLGVVVALVSTGVASEKTSKSLSIDFEDSGGAEWALFVPEESRSAGCAIATDREVAHGGAVAARLQCSATSRFGVFAHEVSLPVRPGERYRLSAWVRVGEDFVCEPGSSGLLARCTLFGADGRDSAGGHSFFSRSGIVRTDPGDLDDSDREPWPVSEWICLAGEITIPEGTAWLRPFVFVWKGRGSVWIDDVVCERLATGEGS